MKKKVLTANAPQVGAKAQQEKNGVVGSIVEIANLPIQIIEEKVMLSKTKDAIKLIQGLADNGDSDAAYYR